MANTICNVRQHSKYRKCLSFFEKGPQAKHLEKSGQWITSCTLSVLQLSVETLIFNLWLWGKHCKSHLGILVYLCISSQCCHFTTCLWIPSKYSIIYSSAFIEWIMSQIDIFLLLKQVTHLYIIDIIHTHGSKPSWYQKCVKKMCPLELRIYGNRKRKCVFSLQIKSNQVAKTWGKSPGVSICWNTSFFLFPTTFEFTNFFPPNSSMRQQINYRDMN